MPNIDSNGVSLNYESFGDERHPAIVLIMGLGAQMILWPDALCELLAAAGFRVIRFDNRDAGLSTHLHHLGKPNIALQYIKFMMGGKLNAPYKIDDMAADAAGLIGALNLGRVHIVGASMGGMIAQNLAASVPTQILSLTSIMSTTGRRSLPKSSWRATKVLLTPAAKHGDTEAAIKRMMNVFGVIASRTYPPTTEQIRDICTRHVMRANHPDGGARQLLAIAASGDRTNIVRQIKVPTLVIHGDEDELIPYPAGLETARMVREGGGQATSIIIEGMGHDMPEILLPRLAEAIVSHCRAVPS